MRTARDRVVQYPAKDGSLVRELVHPAVQGNCAQSLAEAEIPPGFITTLHRHRQTGELYHIISGTGRLTRGADAFEVKPGDTVCITPGTPLRIANTGHGPLSVLCCCMPAYSHDDTELLE